MNARYWPCLSVKRGLEEPIDMGTVSGSKAPQRTILSISCHAASEERGLLLARVHGQEVREEGQRVRRHDERPLAVWCDTGQESRGNAARKRGGG
jgi:hypothetical protein